jgi:hypothetical protein
MYLDIVELEVGVGHQDQLGREHLSVAVMLQCFIMLCEHLRISWEASI